VELPDYYTTPVPTLRLRAWLALRSGARIIPPHPPFILSEAKSKGITEHFVACQSISVKNS